MLQVHAQMQGAQGTHPPTTTTPTLNDQQLEKFATQSPVDADVHSSSPASLAPIRHSSLPICFSCKNPCMWHHSEGQRYSGVPTPLRVPPCSHSERGKRTAKQLQGHASYLCQLRAPKQTHGQR